MLVYSELALILTLFTFLPAGGAAVMQEDDNVSTESEDERSVSKLNIV